MNKLESYTSVTLAVAGKTQLPDESYAIAEILTELTDAINRLAQRIK